MPEYIDRKVLLKEIEAAFPSLSLLQQPNVAAIRDYVKMMPVADVVERKRGEWVQIGYDELMDRITCSCCNEYFSTIDNCTEQFNFCPNCGADMREG